MNENFSLIKFDNNWNKLVHTIKRSNLCNTIRNNDNLISDYLKISLNNYREIFKTQFNDLVKIENGITLFDNSLTIEQISDAIDVAKVTVIMFGEEEKTKHNPWWVHGVGI